MIDAGDIALADLRDERRHRVLVVSTARFHRLAHRCVVVPSIPGDPDETPFPWRVDVDGTVFAVDLIRSLPIDRVLDVVGVAPPPAFDRVRRAVRHLT